MWKVNTKGKNKIKTLIGSGDIDFNSPWSFTTKDGKVLLGENEDWTKYGSVHLAIDSEQTPETVGYFGYPVAKMKGDTLTVYRSGVIAAKGAAAGARGAEKNEAIYNAADLLLKEIDSKMDAMPMMKCPECGEEIEEGSKTCSECETELDACGGGGKKKKEKEMDKSGKKKTDSQDVERFDIYEFEDDSWMEEKFTTTPEGYLTGRAIVTNIGVFSYMNADGTIRRELRLPEEVFSRESLDSLKAKPITNNHPDTKVTVDNIKEFQVGFTGDEIRTSPYHVSVPITITDKKTIQDDIKAGGKRALSAGYMVNLDERPGVYLGVPYDAIQRNIRNNHIAIVDRGRAGDAAKMKMDGLENSAYRLVGDSVKNYKEDTMPEQLKKLVIDGVDYQAEGEVIKAYNQEKARADALTVKVSETEKSLTETKTNLSKVEAERDNLKARVDSQEKEIQSIKADEGKINAAVEKKLSLLTAAYSVGVEVKADMKDEDIQKAVITRAFPDVKLDGKDAAYIQGRFDGAIEILLKRVDNENRDSFLTTTPKNDSQVLNADKARESMIKNMKDAWKNEEKK